MLTTCKDDVRWKKLYLYKKTGPICPSLRTDRWFHMPGLDDIIVLTMGWLYASEC